MMDKQITNIFIFYSTIICLAHGSVIGATPTSLKLYEEPEDTYLIKNIPKTLKCKIENARTGFFKCNDQWIQEDMISTKTLQVGNKQILAMEIDITRSQLDEHRRLEGTDYWCICQGWAHNGDTITSKKAYIQLAFIGQNFVWEPMTTSGLIGKSIEIRCLPPTGEPKPTISWLKNNEKMNLNLDETRILISNEGSLLINDVRLTDNGNYTCVAENIAGRRMSDMAQLIVEENRGWTEWSNWTDCNSLSMVNCGEGMKKRYRKCLNPPTINNALGCEGFPMQIQTCFVACQTYVWSEWSAWQIECDNEDTCKKIRKRFCIGSEASKCVGESTETVNCSSKTMCFEQNPVSTRLNEIDSIFADSSTGKYLLPIILVIVILFMLLISLVMFICIKNKTCRNLNKIQKKFKSKTMTSMIDEQNPIYYSVQPDPYMDMCTLLESCKYTNSTCHTTNTSCNSSTTDSAIDTSSLPGQDFHCFEQKPSFIKFVPSDQSCHTQQQQYENLNLL